MSSDLLDGLLTVAIIMFRDTTKDITLDISYKYIMNIILNSMKVDVINYALCVDNYTSIKKT
jgi:hypothetical protein